MSHMKTGLYKRQNMKMVAERAPAKGVASSRACPGRDTGPIAIKILIWVKLMYQKSNYFLGGSGCPPGSPDGHPRVPSFSKSSLIRYRSSEACPGRSTCPIMIKFKI